MDINIILCLQEKLLLITSLTEDQIGSCLALNEFQLIKYFFILIKRIKNNIHIFYRFIINVLLIKLKILTSNSLDKQCLYIISPLAFISDFIEIIPIVMEFLKMV